METGDLLAPGGADAFVRAARPGDAAAIGAVQLRCWRHAYAGVLPAATLAALSGEDLAAPWHAAVAAPPSARHAVLVACSGTAVVGFSALAPATDADATDADVELVALEVDPAHRRTGHASRLLAAVAETARDRGFTTLRIWVPEADTARRAFLTAAGPAPDGARRRLASAPGQDPPTEVVEVRLAAALPDPYP